MCGAVLLFACSDARRSISTATWTRSRSSGRATWRRSCSRCSCSIRSGARRSCAPRGRGCSSGARRCCSSPPRSTSSRCAICSWTRRSRSSSARRSSSRRWAGPMLGEWIHWRRWTAIGVGFCGVLLVTRPGAGGIHPAALLSVDGRVLLCGLFDLDPHPGAHRQHRDHQLLFQSGRRDPGHASRCRSSGRRRAIRSSSC